MAKLWFSVFMFQVTLFCHNSMQHCSFPQGGLDMIGHPKGYRNRKTFFLDLHIIHRQRVEMKNHGGSILQ